MSKHAKIVLWLGLGLILAGIVANWSQISAVLFGHTFSGPGPLGIGSKPGPHQKCPPGTTKTINGMCVPIMLH